MLKKMSDRYFQVLEEGIMVNAHKLINGIRYREPGISMHFETL